MDPASRPKLLVVGGPNLAAEDVALQLSPWFDVEVHSSASARGESGIEAVASAADRGFHGVLMDTGVVLPGLAAGGGGGGRKPAHGSLKVTRGLC